MNKKRTVKLGIIIGIITLFGILGLLGVKSVAEPSVEEKQMAFLKAHENEMTEFVKNQDDKISKVIYDWFTVESETVGNGLPQGGDAISKVRRWYCKYSEWKKGRPFCLYV